MKSIRNNSKYLLKFILSIIAIQFSLTGFAAHIPEPVPEEPAIDGYYPDWSLILEEGNLAVFTAGLEDVVKCLNKERDENQPKQSSTNPTDCQKKAMHLISHKNKMGDSLLKQYMYIDGLTFRDATYTLMKLKQVGVDIHGLTFPHVERALFYAAERHDRNVIAFLLIDAKDEMPDYKTVIPTIKSPNGVTLANLLLKRFANEPGIAILITKYGLAPDLSTVDESSSVAYFTLKHSRIEL